ncbi:MAG: hypothetical protein OEM58_06020, partial [Nitrospirota bacterium]|nr:hypothetical protein [Nitrospirota bacterium]
MVNAAYAHFGILVSGAGGRQSTKNRVEDSIPRLGGPICGNSSCEWGQTGPFSSDWPSLSLHLWLWAGELGKGGVAARELNRN